MSKIVVNCQETPPNTYTNDLTVTLATPIRVGVDAAPSPIWFDVTSVTGCDAVGPGVGEVYDPKFHDLTYIWDFGDASNATPSNSANLMLPSSWKNINKGYGRRVCHVFSDPGTYTVTLNVYEPSTRRTGSATVEVTVADPKVAFPTTRTIIYNPNNIDITSYGYTGAQNITTTWADAVTARGGALAGQTAQILIAPGVVETFTTTMMLTDPNWPNIRIGALDQSLAKPRIIYAGFNNSNNLIRDRNSSNTYERVVFGLRFEGPWDSTKEQGVAHRPFNTNNPGTGLTYLAMQHRCEFTGWEVVSGHTAAADDYTFYLVHSECTVTNWQNYGFHGCNDGNTHLAVIACASTQDVNALSGGGKDSGYYNNHGPLRDFGSQTYYIDVFDSFTRNGWSAGGTGIDGLGISADQACIRINTQGRDGVQGIVSRAVAEGMIWMEEQDSTKVDKPGNHVFDKLLHIINPRTIVTAFNARHGGITIRNAIGYAVNAPGQKTTNFTVNWVEPNNNFGMEPSDTFYASEEALEAENDVPFAFYNNTFVDMRTDTNAGGAGQVVRPVNELAAETFTTRYIENNINHQPNRGTSVTADAPISTSTASGVTCRHKGWRYGFLDESGTLGASVVPGAYFTLSYANVKTTRWNNNPADTGSATDQAYWLANSPAHPNAKHKLIIGGSAEYYANATDNFEVEFTASEIRVYNRTASTTWNSGQLYQIMLDRYAAVPAFDPTYDITGVVVPLPIPSTGSAAINDYATGRRAYDDFLGNVRPSSGDERGALLTA